MGNIHIFTEISPSSGFGHLFRSCTLARKFSGIGQEVSVIVESGNSIDFSLKQWCRTFTRAKIFYVERIKSFCNDQLISSKVDLAVIDGKKFGYAAEELLSKYAGKIVRISDFYGNYTSADYLIDHNFGAEKFCFEASVNTKIFAGIEYLILPQLENIAEAVVNSHDVNNNVLTQNADRTALFCFGGSQLAKRAIQVFHNLLKDSELEGLKIDFFFPIFDSDLNQLFENDTRKELSICFSEFFLMKHFHNYDYIMTSVGMTMWEAMSSHHSVGVLALTEEQHTYFKAELLDYHANYFGLMSSSFNEQTLRRLIREIKISKWKNREPILKIKSKLETALFKIIGEA